LQPELRCLADLLADLAEHGARLLRVEQAGRHFGYLLHPREICRRERPDASPSLRRPADQPMKDRAPPGLLLLQFRLPLEASLDVALRLVKRDEPLDVAPDLRIELLLRPRWRQR